jgi:hypothetical protein
MLVRNNLEISENNFRVNAMEKMLVINGVVEIMVS